MLLRPVGITSSVSLVSCVVAVVEVTVDNGRLARHGDRLAQFADPHDNVQLRGESRGQAEVGAAQRLEALERVLDGIGAERKRRQAIFAASRS
jgi:hypothetical protein